MLKYFVNHVVFQGPNVMQFMIPMRMTFHQEREKKTTKKDVAQKSENGC